MFVFGFYLVDQLHVQRVIITSPDTDVAVLCMYHFYANLAGCLELFFQTGTKDKRRFIPIHSVCNKLGASLCQLLPVFHCLTGCDSTSSFSGIGKKSALNVLVKHKNELLSLADIGDHIDINENSEAVLDVVKFISWLYCPTLPENLASDINGLRYRLFCQKHLSGERLPPTHDALLQHIKRVNFQCYIWKNATTPVLNLPSPVGKGWIEDENANLAHELSTKPAAPSAVIEFTVCRCKKGCKNRSCSCKRNNLVCTDACLCSDDICENTFEDNEIVDDDSDTDDDYE